MAAPTGGRWSASPKKSASGRKSPASATATIWHEPNRRRPGQMNGRARRWAGELGSGGLFLRRLHVAPVDLRQRTSVERRFEGAQAFVDRDQFDDRGPSVYQILERRTDLTEGGQ